MFEHLNQKNLEARVKNILTRLLFSGLLINNRPIVIELDYEYCYRELKDFLTLIHIEVILALTC